jgi:hypothetical protein
MYIKNKTKNQPLSKKAGGSGQVKNKNRTVGWVLTLDTEVER